MPEGTDRADRGLATSPHISVIGQSRRAHVRRIAAHLSDAGYEVDIRADLSDVSSGVTMFDLSAASSVDDSAIGDVSRFRSVPGRAVIVFTSSRDLHPVVAAFDAGADDMLIAPFTVEELLARVARAAAGNRPPGSSERSTVILTQGPVELDVGQRRVTVNDRLVMLTGLEFRLLSFFLMHPDEPLTRARLLAEVWGFAVGGTETVTVHVRRLREKIEEDPARPALIRTVWGIGYRFSPSGI